jgi:hypothetical protein
VTELAIILGLAAMGLGVALLDARRDARETAADRDFWRAQYNVAARQAEGLVAEVMELRR